MTERLADRTHHGPDRRHPDDVPLPGTEDLTPLENVEHHTTDWCAAHGPHPCACWHDGEGQAVDLDHLALTVAPRAPVALDGLPVTTPTLRPGLL